MKNKFIYIAVLFGLLLTANAMAQLSGKRIYIDPGHDGFGSGDRNVATINFGIDTSSGSGNGGFYESRTNVVKGLEVRRLCQEAGASVGISRTTTPQSVSLSQRVTLCNSFNADAFISIHSNAFDNTGSANYLLILWGTTNAGSIVTNATTGLAGRMWDRMWDNDMTPWTGSYSATNKNIKSQALAVVNNSTRPCVLSEGSFHDYKPETHRLLSTAYCHMEAFNIFRGFIGFFNSGGAGGNTKGAIIGHMKDNTKSITANNPTNGSRYLASVTPRSHDSQWPINGAKAELLQNGNVVKTYTVDNNWNGIFGFFDLAAGSYQVRLSAANYITKTVNVTVTANGLTRIKETLAVDTGPVIITDFVVGTAMNAPYTPLLTAPYKVAIGTQVAAVGVPNASAPGGWNARTDNFTWTSSATNVATVNAFGQINGVGNGVATITAVVTNGGSPATQYATGSSLSFTLTVGTGITLPVVPTITAPANASILPNPITVTWGADPLATRGFTIERSTDSSFPVGPTTISETVGAGTNQFTLPALAGINYVRVRANYGTTETTAWSGVISFTVLTPAVVPTITLPIDESNLENPVTVIWDADPLATRGFTVELSTLDDFSDATSTPVDAGINELTLPDLPDGVYYVRVQANYGTTETTAWSEVISFSITSGEVSVLTPKKDEINVYPTKTGIAVQFNGEADIELYSITGLLIDKAKAYQFYSRDLEKGVYILRVNGQSKKFVK